MLEIVTVLLSSAFGVGILSPDSHREIKNLDHKIIKADGTRPSEKITAPHKNITNMPSAIETPIASQGCSYNRNFLSCF